MQNLDLHSRATVPLTLTSRLRRRESCTTSEGAQPARDAESASPLPVKLDSAVLPPPSFPSRSSVENPGSGRSSVYSAYSPVENSGSVPPPFSPLPPVKSDSEVLPSAYSVYSAVKNPPAVHSASAIENLLNEIASILRRFVILPPHAAETLALWVLHTYVFNLRDISTYIGIESSGKGCGKTTLLRVLGKLVQKPVSTANVSPSALFRVIEELQPTLLIDEGDTFLRNNDELRGILNAGYTPDTAFVLRASSEASVQSSVTSVQSAGGLSNQSSVTSNQSKTENGTLNTSSKSGFRQFSTWCPKAIAMIGRLPDTLADRCIIIRMQKKPTEQKCERLRDLDVADLPARCAEFARHHADAIAKARPQIPTGLSDRAADIWEPLLVLADLADGKDDVPVVPNPGVFAPSRSSVENSPAAHSAPSIENRKSEFENSLVVPPLLPPLPPVKSDSEVLPSAYSVYSAVKNSGSIWPELARTAALSLSTASKEQNPIASLLSDIQKIFAAANTNRLFTRTIVQALDELPDRPWRDLGQSQRITSTWLSGQLRPHGITSKTMWINGKAAKGYDYEDFQVVFKVIGFL